MFAFYSDKTVRLFVDDKLKKTLIFDNNFKKIICTREFKNEHDIFCVIFMEK